MLIYVILFFASLLSLIISIAKLILNKLDAVLLSLIFFSMISYLISIIGFYRNTNKYPLNDLSEYYINKFKRLLIKKEDCYIIQFSKIDGIWICKNDSELIRLDLRGYLFQKKYLISFVIRNLRYSLISNKLPFKYLFKNKFFIGKKINVKLEMVDRNKKNDKMIVKNGISKYGFIAKNITFSPFYLFSFSNRSYQSIKKFISYIDEKKYKQFFVKK